MAWTSNLDVSKLPLVLAGPMLRKVGETSVTVWFALTDRATVKLEVRDGAGVVLTGAGDTCAVGAHLHIVAVTAKTFASARVQKLTEGVIYTYDADFELKSATGDFIGVVPGLSAATRDADLAYGALGKPSFCLPPSDRNKLRLMHGSCRRTNAPGIDALALLDGLIGDTASHADRRPHQLFLTGDQIYADDLPASLLMMLTDASDKLLGWQEMLPLPTNLGGLQRGVDLVPIERKMVGEAAGLTTGDGHNHLLSLGEYLCMYLFVWSPVLSEAMNAPSAQDVLDRSIQVTPVNLGLLKSLSARGLEASRRAFKSGLSEIDEDIKHLTSFERGIGKVRKALANIPTYMMMDDHEITDDLNMTYDCCRKVYGKELGRRIIQNGLVAYALCQHWGNAPEQFDDGAPGRVLAIRLNNTNANTYAADADRIRKLVGVHTIEEINRRTPRSVYHDLASSGDPGSLFYDYTVEGLGHQVLVCDTRTWRAFPNGPKEAGELLPKAQLERQIVHAGRPTGDRTLFVVLGTNIPPSPLIRLGEKHPNVAKLLQYNQPAVDLPDSWTLPSAPLDRLVNAISERLPKVGQGYQGGAVLLSGDTHHGFLSRMSIKGRRRFEDFSASPASVDMVVVQLVSSGLRNQEFKTLALQWSGHRNVFQTAPREGFYGWVWPPNNNIVVGSKILDGRFTVSEQVRAVTGRTYPREALAGSEARSFKITLQPDYRYSFRYLPAHRDGDLSQVGSAAPGEARSGATPAEELRRQRELSRSYRVYIEQGASTRQIVGYCNLAEINFNWGSTPQERVILQTLRWMGKGSRLMLTTFAANLDPRVTDVDQVAPVSLA